MSNMSSDTCFYDEVKLIICSETVKLFDIKEIVTEQEI
jgi:peroxiredoxin family protein